MNSKHDYYDFGYSHVQAALNKHIEAMIEVIQDMRNDLLTAHHAEYSPDTGDWIDSELADNAHKSIVRQLISWLDNCQPPVWDEIEWAFLTRQDLNPDYAKEHFQEIAASGYDDREKCREQLLDEYIKQYQEQQANAPKVDKQAITQALVKDMPGLFFEFDMCIDTAMANHKAEFLNATDNPEIPEDDYADKELHQAVSLALSRAMADFYRQTMPNVLEAYNTPFIFPQSAIEYARKQLEGDANG